MRGQIDLIDFQSMLDGLFRFLLNYIDHGVKFFFSIPIVHKTASSIAIALLQIFTIIGPPMILQSDNGAEFHGAAMNDRQRKLHGNGTLVSLANNELAAIITEIKQLWPECRMVRGSPRHSQSNGGVERPYGDALRNRAGDHMEKFAESMKKSAQKRSGGEKICEVGEVVHVALKNEDKAKVDSSNLTGVIEKVDKTRSQARVAVKSGLLKSWYVYHRLGQVTGVGNNVELNGLTDALNGWESMKIILEREAARK